MPKKPAKLRKDENELAFGIVQAMIGEGPRPMPPGEREKNPEAVRRGAKGGKAGGRARADRLSKKRRSQIAKKGAKTRWHGPS